MIVGIANIVLVLFIIATAITAVRVRELLSSVFILGAFSFFLAVLWALLGAVDVSFTEAMVGAGASTIFLLFALYGCRHTVNEEIWNKQRWLALGLISALGLLFIWGSLDLPWLGDAFSPPNAYLSPYYLQNCIKDMATPNAVTAVVVDYRGFDTLIESTVIFTAGVACLLVIRNKK
ncbi:MAG: DUF4040 domain-containing protein [Candidatus Omnitrophica bacterium]|nr:DUF4040 domain-containing protein [Candidatus Omnitrophota bacterium]